ncbi:MAG: cupin domain-containing protein [Planctomycetota bacterium]|nr:cupin domain-containing protein [Planctomycetota bacterium]
MFIRRPESVEAQSVQMDGVAGVSMRLLVGKSDGAPTFSMRLFDVTPGGHTPRHSHPYEHEVIVVEGEGRVEHNGSLHPIQKGDVLYMEPGAMHQFTNPGPAPLSFICLVPQQHSCGESVPGS